MSLKALNHKSAIFFLVLLMVCFAAKLVADETDVNDEKLKLYRQLQTAAEEGSVERVQRLLNLGAPTEKQPNTTSP